MLRYETYKNDRLAVFGDRNKYNTIIKEIGGRWNPRMPDGPGWNIASSAEDKLKSIIERLKKEAQLENTITNAKTRKIQQKYKRARSGSSDKSDEEQLI